MKVFVKQIFPVVEQTRYANDLVVAPCALDFLVTTFAVTIWYVVPQLRDVTKHVTWGADAKRTMIVIRHYAVAQQMPIKPVN